MKRETGILDGDRQPRRDIGAGGGRSADLVTWLRDRGAGHVMGRGGIRASTWARYDIVSSAS